MFDDLYLGSYQPIILAKDGNYDQKRFKNQSKFKEWK